MDSIGSQVRALLAQVLELDVERFRPDSALGGEFRLGPRELFRLFVALEMAFDVHLKESDVRAFRTVADIERHLRSLERPARSVTP